MTSHAPLRAAVYTRLSYSPDGSLETTDRQEADCRRVAERLGASIDEVFCDNNRSAWRRNVRRPGWEKLLEGIAAGRWDLVITYHGDRLMRQPRDLEELLTLADNKALSLASAQGVRDLSNADDRFILRIEVAHACRSSDDTSRRVSDKAKAAAQAGRFQPGRYRGYGYSRDGMTIIEPEAAVIREAADRVLAGASLRSVLHWLITSGVPTVTGAAWTRAAVRGILTHPRIAGLRALRGEVVGPGLWEPIVDRETWEDLCRVLTPRRRGTGRPPTARVHLLSGIALCASCETGLTAHRRTDHASHVYYCANPTCPGPKVSRAKTHIDRYVAAATVGKLNEPDLLDRLDSSRREPDAAREIAALEQRKADAEATLRELADRGDVDPRLVAESISGFERRIAELRGRLAATERDRLLMKYAGITRETWDALPLDVQRVLVASCLRVTVLPSSRRGPGFDPESVRLDPVV